ncbi:MAG: PD-(D/E)XK nuclease family protein, partial [Evtepia sp.]
TLIARFFASPLGEKMRRVTKLHREFQFSVLTPAERYFEIPAGESILLQGVIDCWFETEEGICLVDFKTDRVFGEKIEERAETYREQLNVYCYALEEITHRPVTHRILWFLIPNRGVELI